MTYSSGIERAISWLVANYPVWTIEHAEQKWVGRSSGTIYTVRLVRSPRTTGGQKVIAVGTMPVSYLTAVMAALEVSEVADDR